jgi:hypothetical protein
MALGHREHPARKLPVTEDLKLINLTLKVEQLVREFRTVELRELLHDLQNEAK